MDLVLEWLDGQAFDSLYANVSPEWLAKDRSNVYRQFISIYLIVAIGGVLLYFSCSGLNWLLVFDKAYLKHVSQNLKMNVLYCSVFSETYTLDFSRKFSRIKSEERS